MKRRWFFYAMSFILMSLVLYLSFDFFLIIVPTAILAFIGVVILIISVVSWENYPG